MDIKTLELYFLLFIIYSNLGWLAETIIGYFITKKFVNRGFLIGPVCPIYGVGALIITVLLTKYYGDYFVIFGLSAIICGVLEYSTSYFMEKLFNARWWDYTDHKFNINGRVCLDYIILFGIGGVFVIQIGNPILNQALVYIINESVIAFLTISFAVLLIVDYIASINVINKIKNIKDMVKSQVKDNTEEITRRVVEIINEKSIIYRRVIHAFPQAFASKLKETAEKVKNRTIRTIRNVRLMTLKNVRIVKKHSNRITNILKNINGSIIQRISKRGKNEKDSFDFDDNINNK